MISSKLSADYKDQEAQLQNLLTAVTTQLKSHQDFSKKTGVEIFNLLDPKSSKDKILKIPHQIKSASVSGMTGVTTLIHLDKHHPKLSNIKINAYRDMEDLAKTGWDEDVAIKLQGLLSVTLVYKNGTREYYFVKGAPTTILNNLRELATTMAIVEFSLAKGYALNVGTATLRPSTMWDEDWESKADAVYYDKINDPLIIEQFNKEVLPLERKKEEPLKVFDIGAGKGRLANKLISIALEQKISVDYTVVEPSENQMDITRKALKKYATEKTCKITFIQSTLQDSKLETNAHCVLSSGGPLNLCVVTRDNAIANVKAMSDLLLPHGILIATGRTALLAKAKHFAQAGLKVLSYSKPLVMPVLSLEEKKFGDTIRESSYPFFNNRPQYVCKKKTAAAIQGEQTKTSTESCCVIQ